MDDSFSAVSKCIKQRAVIEFLTREYETPTGIHRRLLTFFGEDTVDISTVRRWVIKSRDSDGNLDLHNQSLSGRPVTATHDLNWQQFNELIEENG
jgi:hypothetical protein